MQVAIPRPRAGRRRTVAWLGSIRNALARHPAALTFLIFLGLAFLLFASVWRSPSTLAVGNVKDTPQFVWFLRWIPFAISHGYPPLLTDYVDYPDGANLMWNTSIPLLGLLLAPVTLHFGAVVALNLLSTVSPALAASTASLAFRRYVRSPIAAATGGFLYGFSPYVLAHSLGHPQLAVVFIPPLMFLALDDILIRQRRSPVLAGAGLGLLAAAQLLIGEEVLAMGVIVAVPGVILLVALNRNRVGPRILYAARALLVAAGVFLVLGAYPLAVQFLGPQRSEGLHQPPIFYAADVVNFVVPTRLQLLAPRPALDVSARFRGGVIEDDAYLGFPLVALIFYVGRRWWNHPGVRWASVLAAVAAVLALGSRLHFLGVITQVPLPWSLFASLPLLDQILTARFTLYLYLLIGLLLALFVDMTVAGTGRRQLAFGSVVTLLVIAALFPRPLPALAMATPPFFTNGGLSQIPAGSVALIAPFAGASSSEAMGWQAAAAMRFRMPEGYIYGPTWINPPPSNLQTAMLQVQLTGDGIGLDGRSRHLLLEDLRRWDVQTVIVGPMAHEDAMVFFFRDLLGRDPIVTGGVYVWWHVEAIPEAELTKTGW